MKVACSVECGNTQHPQTVMHFVGLSVDGLVDMGK